MSHDTVRTRRGRRTTRTLLLLCGLAAAGLWIIAGPSIPSVRGQTAAPPPSPPPAAPPAPPTERIDVEQAVSFPYDI